MDCLQARRLAAQGNAEAQAHVDTCPVCRTVLAIAPAPPGPEAVAAHLTQLQGALARESGPLGGLRAMPRWTVAVVAALLALGLCGWVAVAMPRPDWATALHAERRIWLWAAFFLLAVATRWMSRSSFAPQVSQKQAVGILLVAAMAGLLAQVVPPLQRVSVLDASFWLGAGRCFRFGAVLLLPLAAWLLLTRRGSGLSVPLRLALGTVFGLVAVVALELHCPNPELSHRLLGHGAVMALFAAGAGLRP